MRSEMEQDILKVLVTEEAFWDTPYMRLLAQSLAYNLNQLVR